MIKQKAEVSVVIPNYNSKKTIIRAIESVIHQSLIPEEIIIVDDKSTDTSCDIINECIVKYNDLIDIKLFELEQNSGPAKARNVGWEKAKSEYIAFLDSDDSWHPQKIELQYNFMIENPDITLTGHLYKVVNEEQVLFSQQNIGKIEEITKRKLLIRNRFATSTVMLKRNINFRFNELQKYSEDYRLWLEIVFSDSKMVLIYSNLCFYYKDIYGASGLSSYLFKMWYSELNNYKFLYQNGNIGIVEYVFILLLSSLKFFKRQFFVSIRKLLGKK